MRFINSRKRVLVMPVSAETLLVYFMVILAGSLIFNMLSIHVMANLVLYEGSSLSKTFSISTEFAILTAIFPVSIFTVAQIIGFNLTPDMGLVFYAVFGGSGLIIELFRIWYVRDVYETNTLNALIIAEGVMVFLYLLLLVLSNTFLALI